MGLPAWLGAGAVAAAFAGALYLQVAGSAIVHDDENAVVAAVVTNDIVQRRLVRLPGGLFYVIPGFDGIIEVRCRDGSRARAGYVTGGLHTSVTLVSASPCRLRENL